MQTRKILGIVIPLFLLIATGIYWLLGGFREAEVALVELEQGYTLVGKQYVGTLEHPALQDLLDDVGRRWEAGELPGVLTVAVLKEPKTSKKDTVEQFIGVIIPQNTAPGQLPKGYERLELPANSAIRVRLEAHPSVWPTPDKLREKAEAFAQEHGYEVQPGILLEKYYGNNRLEVELPIRKTAAAAQ